MPEPIPPYYHTLKPQYRAVSAGERAPAHTEPSRDPQARTADSTKYDDNLVQAKLKLRERLRQTVREV